MARHERYLARYEEQYLLAAPSWDELVIRAWRARDSVFSAMTGRKPGIVAGMTKTRELPSLLAHEAGDNERNHMRLFAPLEGCLPNEFLVREARRLCITPAKKEIAGVPGINVFQENHRIIRRTVSYHLFLDVGRLEHE